MLPKVNRLTEKSDFDRAVRDGRVFQSQSFGLAVLEEKDFGAPPKFGFIISNKISKKAVDRNRVRRIMRDVVRKSLDLIPSGYIFIFLAKKSIIERSALELRRELEEILRKI